MSIEENLQQLGLTLPDAPKPVAAYLPAIQSGRHLFVSGQLPFQAGELMATGKVPEEASEEAAQAAARQCVLNGLAVLKSHIDGDWSRFVQVVRVGAFVQSNDNYYSQPAVANVASELLQEIFGEAGRHARAAVGVNALPLDAAVEIEFVFEITES